MVPHRLVRRGVLALAALVVGVTALPGAARAGTTETYVVLYRQWSVPADAAARVANAGGTLVHAYPEIGVVIARSDSSSFRAALMRDGRVQGAAATTNFGVRLDEVDSQEGEAEGPPAGELPNAPATDADNLSPLQWDMRQIHAPEAHAITGGSPAVVAGIIDTGVDKDHADLAPNLDFSRSASCESGAPDQNPAAWDDRHGHGTHTAGTVAAASNGFGIVGTAPNVSLAAIKSSNDDGYFFPEMVICSFVWAGNQRIDVTNNSYFADPFLFNCRNDPVQRAIWKAEQRAIMYAQQRGVAVVASAGNQRDDLAHPDVDVISPDFPPGSEVEREVTNACVVIPVEIPGVIGVSAVGNFRQTDDDDDPDDYQKSFYSNYGVGAIQLTAPGGDSRFPTAEAPNGRVLSTWPEEIPCFRPVADPEAPVGGTTYCYLQGTSMAAPHVAGVAALIISRFGDARTPQNGKMRPQQVKAFLDQTADPQPCPTTLPPTYPSHRVTGEPQECQGGEGYNSWYGNGHVNALSAVTHTARNE